MISVPVAFLDTLENGLWLFAAIFLRVSALISVMPAFGERSVPVRIKLVLSIMFALVIFPAVPGFEPPTSLTTLSRFALTETVIGLAFGMGLRLFILALQTAGAIAAQSTSLSQILGGAAVDPLPAMGYILVLAGLALAVMAGLHVRAAELLLLTYELFPAGRFPDGQILSSWGLAQTARAFSLAFTLAAPFVIASLVYNLALGAINRAMPQLMVAFVGAPVITFGGLALLLITAPVLLQVWLDALIGFSRNPMAAPG
ncbi:flagellar biosynthetic protein FliR [Thalassococcus sp. S3]|uniref:flagellar biosynthetic protein FliR n=1 Tax=Thalassococcus sp. S3 TaxID=2017482 RepID=UPI001024216E|nr:flagellar biosynthetic protein FliR [Thalassococcus sp. S3]QBF29697.1 flagellar biosynthesis protein FliR [Thalassococcus sp. S3]